METITNNNMNSIADEIYNQSRLLTTNLRAKGISNIDASMGLNTLINKVLLINPETPTTTTLETRITHNLKNGYGINKPFNINGKLLVINTTNNTLIGYLQNTPIQIYDGNNLIGTCITDNQGEYNLTFTPKNTGTINLKIVFEGNQYYESSSTNTIPINIYNYNNITLTITDTILSYENDDTTTLTAQIQLNGNNIQQENILVKFYESDDDCLIGESYTDSNGLATYTYESQGKGDLNIHAKIDNITSNTVNIEDCIYYNPNTISSTQTLNITKNIPTNFKTEYIAKLNSRTVWVEIGADNNNCLLFGSTGDSGKQLGEYVRVDGSYEIYKGISCLPNTSENSIVYTYYNGEQTVTSNDNTTRLNSSTIIDRTYLATHVEGGYIKELKIKPYSPKTEYGLSAYLPSNVISYNDDESCTIDVQLMKNNYPYKKSGETVELNLINSKGEILSTEDTQITDEDGQCTLTYDSKGYGDIQLRIDYNDTSIIYDIEDCVKYFEGEYSSVYNFNYDLPSNFKIEYEAYYVTGTASYLMIGESDSKSLLTGHVSSAESDYSIWVRNGSDIKNYGETIEFGNYVPQSISYDGVNYNFNDITVSNLNGINPSKLLRIGNYNNGWKFKNIKIKELNNIQISNTKDILSYKDNDSTTITAVVDNPVCIDKPIVFTVTDKNDEIVDIYSTILDDTGVVDYTYNSQGKGDLTVTVESMFLKETYKNIEDCYKTNLSASHTFNSSDSKYKILELPNNYTAYEIEGNLKSTVNNRFSVGLKVDNDNSSKSMVRIGAYTTIEGAIFGSNGETIARDLNGGTYTANTDMKVKFAYNNGNFKLYANDTLRVDANVSFYPIHLMIHSYTNSKTVSVSDIKIKPL